VIDRVENLTKKLSDSTIALGSGGALEAKQILKYSMNIIWSPKDWCDIWQ